MTEPIEIQVALIQQELKSLEDELEEEKAARKELETELKGVTDKLKVGKGIVITLIFMLGGAGVALGTGIKHWLGIN